MLAQEHVPKPGLVSFVVAAVEFCGTSTFFHARCIPVNPSEGNVSKQPDAAQSETCASFSPVSGVVSLFPENFSEAYLQIYSRERSLV